MLYIPAASRTGRTYRFCSGRFKEDLTQGLTPGWVECMPQLERQWQKLEVGPSRRVSVVSPELTPQCGHMMEQEGNTLGINRCLPSPVCVMNITLRQHLITNKDFGARQIWLECCLIIMVYIRFCHWKELGNGI